MDSIIIVGSSGHARVVIDIVEQEKRYKIAGLLDGFRAAGEETLGYKILGKEEDLPALVKKHLIKGILIAIGDNFARSTVLDRVQKICPELRLVSAIHPKSAISRDVSIGDGTVVMAGASVNPCSTIGRGCILNTNSSLDHDCNVSDFASLAPGVSVGGTCKIGGFSALGIGAAVIQNISVGEHSVIGAGATVLRNVGDYKVAYGTPAKVIRERPAGEKYL